MTKAHLIVAGCLAGLVMVILLLWLAWLAETITVREFRALTDEELEEVTTVQEGTLGDFWSLMAYRGISVAKMALLTDEEFRLMKWTRTLNDQEFHALLTVTHYWKLHDSGRDLTLEEKQDFLQSYEMIEPLWNDEAVTDMTPHQDPGQQH